MLKRVAFTLIITSLINSAVLLLSGTALAASSCKDIKNLKLDHAVITSTSMVSKGPAPKIAGIGGGTQNEMPQPDLPAHCRVEIDLTPTTDSMIKMELWLPVENWNRKFMGVGNGFFAGSIQGMMFDMPEALRLGYATAGTDTGHQEQGGEWAIGHPEKMIDFAYRSTHEMTLKAKEIIKAFYNRDGVLFDIVRIAFNDPKLDWRKFDLDRDMPLINKAVGYVDAVDPDLSRFKASNGKLLFAHGWSDTGITPETTIWYYESVLEKMGKDQGDWVRLFLVPGMGHCGGGHGVNSMDSIGILEQWVEKGVAPDQIMGYGKDGLTRPLCPYPKYAEYKGTGDLKDKDRWQCVEPAKRK